MLSEREIDGLLRHVDSKGRVVEAATVSPVDGQLMAGDADGLVTGDILAGGVAESQNNIVVAGAVLGEAERMCHIKAKAQVLLHAGAQYAHVAGQRIHIEQDVEHCVLVSDQAVRIGGDVALTKIVIGKFRSHQERWLRLEREAADAERSRDDLRLRFKFSAGRLVREAQSTRVAFDLNLGLVLSARAGSLQVDLRPIYAVLKGENKDARDQAVEEFFHRVVIASLTKANAPYMATNKSGRGVFLKLLTHLGELVQLARAIDRLAEDVEAAKRESQALVESLQHLEDLILSVGGHLGEDSEIEFVIPSRSGEEGDLSIEVTTARMSVKARESSDVFDVTVSDPSGKQVRQQVSRQELTGVVVSCSGGDVDWRPLASREMEGSEG